MANSFDPRTELARVHDAEGAWSFVRGFAGHWSSPLSSDDGCDESDIEEAERRLGIRVPQALGDGYRLCGRRNYHLVHPLANAGYQDRLLRPEELRLDQDRAALVYRSSDEYHMEWAVRLTGEPDPPVVCRETGSTSGWQAFLPSVSWAWVEMDLAESLFSADLAVDREVERGDIPRLEQDFSRLAIPDYPLWAVPGGVTRWFGGQDVILREDAGIWLWARCHTPAALHRLYTALPGDW